MLPRARATALATLGSLLACVAGARAQVTVPLNRAGSGARAAGMANAFIAVSDDGTAASWNPAGLAQLRKPELSLVYAVSDNVLRWSGLRSPDGAFAYSPPHFQYVNSSPDFASAAVPFSLAGKQVTLQLGWQRLYQLGSAYDGNVDRYLTAEPSAPLSTSVVDSRVRGDIDALSMAGALKLTKHASIGGSLDFWRGDWTQQRAVVEPNGASASDFLFGTGRRRVRGHTFTAGVLLSHTSWSAGLVYHHPFWSSLTVWNDVQSSRTAPSSEQLGLRLQFPRSLGAGVAWRPAARWTLAFDLTHDQWTKALVKGLPGETVNFFDEVPPSISTTRDTVALNLGAEHLFVREGRVVPVRFGIAWEPQGPMDPVTRDPVDFLMLSAGGGYNTNSFKFDAAVQYRWGKFLLSDNFTVQTALAGGPVRDGIGQARTREWRVKLSAIYRLPDTDKLRGFLRRIFG
jgi:long-subunit fatty acid transport protein